MFPQSYSQLFVFLGMMVCTHVCFGADADLFKAEAMTEAGLFTEGIEGPACDREGNVYVVNFARQGTIGRTTPERKSEVFVTLPEGSIGNGIVFDPSGAAFFVADYTGHNVLRVELKSRRIGVFAHEAKMNQPNDLAMAPDGTLYASDPAWKDGTGQLWRIDRDEKATLLAKDLGTSNGIEVSPDGKTLFVNESVQRNVWAWTITAEKTLTNKRLVRQFPDFGFDGMRCDVDGNLYITRHGKGTVVKMSPSGEILREIDVLGKKPSNLCFGGSDGKTVYVTEVEHRRLVRFPVDRPGLAWARWSKAVSSAEGEKQSAREYVQSGMEHFQAGRVKESIEDFERAARMEPSLEPELWQLGISYYYAAEYLKGRRLFEAHQKVNPQDVENAVWHFLCVTKLDGVEAARRNFISITGDRRVPMKEVHALFAGKGSKEAVLEAARAGNPAEAELKNRMFYACLYLGLYEEAIGRKEESFGYMKRAAGEFAQRHYMGDVAWVHVEIREKD